MPQLAVTVIGRDRPGIIAEAASALAAIGVNIEDSTMTLLRGRFAMTLVTGDAPEGDAVAGAVSGALAQLGDESFSVDVRAVPEGTPTVGGSPYLLSVHGGNRPGIVSPILGEIARVGGNVTDLSTRLAGDVYVLLAECDLPVDVDVAALKHSMAVVARELGVGASLRPVGSDEL